MQINCIVIEDEPLAMQKLTGFIGKIEYLKLFQTFDNAIEAISYLKNNTTDLIFRGSSDKNGTWLLPDHRLHRGFWVIL